MVLGLSYWVLPIFSGCVWLGMLLGMFLWWIVDTHSAHLTPETRSQSIAYISDVGAHKLQPLFIVGGVLTVVPFNIAFVAERYLRHRGKLVPNDSTAQKVLSVCSILAAIVGGIGLILLTCFNDVHFSHVHDTCLVIFIGGYIVSAIFICAEYQRLGIHHREYRHLRLSFWIKLGFIFVEVGLAIAFGALADKKHYNAAAVCEWLVALIYTFYVWSFVIDFIPVVKYRDGFGQEREKSELEVAEERGNGHVNRDGHVNGNGNGNGVVGSNGTANGNGYAGKGNGVINGVDYNQAPVESSNF